MAKIKYKSLPINLTFTDKVDLAGKLLGIYSITVTHLTKRDIDLLTMCMIYDMNSPNFVDMVMKVINAESRENIHTMFSRLRKKGLIHNHRVQNKKLLHPDLESLKELVDSGQHSALYLMYKKDEV
jgi:predicted transcriptional regulator